MLISGLPPPASQIGQRLGAVEPGPANGLQEWLEGLHLITEPQLFEELAWGVGVGDVKPLVLKGGSCERQTFAALRAVKRELENTELDVSGSLDKVLKGLRTVCSNICKPFLGRVDGHY